jgi:hypothetical protein
MSCFFNSQPVMFCLWHRSRNEIKFTFENTACTALLFSVPSYILYLPLLIFPSPSSVVWWGSMGNLFQWRSEETACHPFWLSRSRLYRARSRSRLHIVVPGLENKYLFNCKRVWVTLRMNVNAQLKVITAQNMLRHTDKPRSLLIVGFNSNKYSDNLFVYCITT